MVERVLIVVVWLMIRSFLILSYLLTDLRVSVENFGFLPWRLEVIPPLDEAFEIIGVKEIRRILRS